MAHVQSFHTISSFSTLRPANKPYTIHRLLLGTHTSGQAQDYLQIAQVQLPKRDESSSADKLDRGDYDDERGELGGHNIPAQPHIQIIQRINHEGEVNRARYMPQNPDIIATKAVTGEIFVFDRTKHPSEPERGGVCKPDIKLVGQTKEGQVRSNPLHCQFLTQPLQFRLSLESFERRSCSRCIGGHYSLPLVRGVDVISLNLTHLTRA